jgi:hypothetical protein
MWFTILAALFHDDIWIFNHGQARGFEMKTTLKRLTFVTFAVIVALIYPNCGPAPTGEPGEKGLKFTLVDQDTKSVLAGEMGSFRILIVNKGPLPDTITCIKNNALPDSQWSAFFCIGGRCFSATIDSADSGPMAVGSSDTCSLDMQTGMRAGSGQVTLKVYNKADPAQCYEHTFTCTVAQNEAGIVR